MQVIRTAEDMARLLGTALDPPLRLILEGHCNRLAEYADVALEELAVFAVCERGDTLETLEHAIGRQPILWEHVCSQGGWIEAVTILSDDGFGWVVTIPDRPDTDSELLQIT